MLIFDFHTIGNKLHAIRKRNGLTQAEVAEKAGLSDRTYADIERGSVAMRVDSLLKICTALHITPDDVLVSDETAPITEQDVLDAVRVCSNTEKETALKLLAVYLDSLK